MSSLLMRVSPMTSMQLPNPKLENTYPESNNSQGNEKIESVIRPSLEESKIDPIKMNAQDITSAYKIFLNRAPENEQVVDSRIDKSPDEILAGFMNSSGFLSQPFFRTLILTLAKEIKQAYDKKNTSVQNK